MGTIYQIGMDLIYITVAQMLCHAGNFPRIVSLLLLNL